MTRGVMLIVGLGDTPTPFDGQYVVEYDPHREGVDPSGRPMLCHLVTTPNRSEATVFDDAFGKYREAHGVRPDGEPNRPITAFHVIIEGA